MVRRLNCIVAPAAVLKQRHIVAAGVARPNHGRSGLATGCKPSLALNIDGVFTCSLKVLRVLAASQHGVRPLIGAAPAAPPRSVVAVAARVRRCAAAGPVFEIPVRD